MNSPRPTIIDVARAAGTSKSVVSRVLSGNGPVGSETRERVQNAMRELGYRANPAGRTLASGRSGTVGVLLRNTLSPFYAHFFTHLQAEAAGDEVRVVGATGNMTPGSELEALDRLLDLGVDALVIGSGRLPERTITEVGERVPTVLIGRPSLDSSVTAVFDDPEAHAALTISTLWNRGHRAAVLFDSTSSTALYRVEALRRAANEFGMRLGTIPAGYDLRNGETAAREWMAGARSETAIITLSHEASVGALWVLAQAGVLVPHDLSVVASDAFRIDMPFLPDVTGTCRDGDAFVRTVWAEIMRAAQNGGSEPAVRQIPVEWHEGETLAPCTVGTVP